MIHIKEEKRIHGKNGKLLVDCYARFPLNPSTSVGNLSHAPPLPDPPDPPDPLQFPPLPSPLSGGQKSPKRRSFSRPSPKTTVPAPLLSTASVAVVNGSFAGAATPPSLPTLSTAELLATFTSLPPCHVSNRRSGLSTVNHESQIPLSGLGILPPPANLQAFPPQTTPPPPNPVVPPKPSYASKTKSTIDRSLRRLSPQSFSPEGIPRVIIPDEVYQKGAELHKDFLICRFFGRAPAYSLIQNVLNYLWAKGKHLEIHMLPQSNSVLVRLPNEFIREKVLQKRYWYVDTSMFYVSLRSDNSEDFTPSLQRIQLWAHLKGVPFDLMYDAGLSHITGQIGEPKKTDDWTLSLSSISVAHVKVEIDTTVPLPTKVEVGRMNGSFVTVDVEYPWIPPSCAHCKEVGNIQRHCPHLPPPTPPSSK